MSNYQGNCINSFDENGDCIVNLPFENVSDFAYACENQMLLTKENFEKLIEEDIEKFTQSKNIEYSYYEGVFMFYDIDADIHYFFKEKDYLLNKKTIY